MSLLGTRIFTRSLPSMSATMGVSYAVQEEFFSWIALALEVEDRAAGVGRAIAGGLRPDPVLPRLPDQIRALRGDAHFGQSVAVEIGDGGSAALVRLAVAARIRGQRQRAQENAAGPVLDAQGGVADDHDLRVRIVGPEAHDRSVLGEVGDGRKAVGAIGADAARAGAPAGQCR